MPQDEAYYRAEEKIEQALKLRSTELDLSVPFGSRDQNFTELPAQIGKLIRLQSINLRSNNLTTLPESLRQLTQLQSLILSDNNLTELSECLGQLRQLQKLDLSNNHLLLIPDWLGKLTQLRSLDLSGNQLASLPKSIGNLEHLKFLHISNNQITSLPTSIRRLKLLAEIYLHGNQITQIPDSIGRLTHLTDLTIGFGGFINPITDLPSSFANLKNLRRLEINDLSLDPELIAARNHGIDSLRSYLRAKAKSKITLNEAKLILVGEGEVGKTCLMDALLGNLWQEHDTTHGIEIKQIAVTHSASKRKITLNGWDFGGQPVYRPTHQLFFSAPAVYLVVWKPREGSQAGQVKEWIHLIKRREPSAKILVVATHGGPQQRQPDIDRQELWDLFGKETVVDFFFVESKPDEQGNRKGIDELKRAIAHVAASLPEVGRSVPKSFADVRQALQDKGAPYLPLREVLAICRAHNMDDEIARLFITISNRLGHLTHYENDPTLRDIVILRPDWLATAISYVLDDEATRAAHGLVKFSRLGQLWDDKNRAGDSRYPATLHRFFSA